MRHIKTACGLAVAVGTLCASAAPTLAASDSSNFIANIPHKAISTERPASMSGKTEDQQVFRFNNIKIVCQRFESGVAGYETEGPTAITTGKVEEEFGTTLEVGISFRKCGYIVINDAENEAKDTYIAGAFKKKVTIAYHVNGFGEILGNGEGEELEYGKGKDATIRETAATFKFSASRLCTVIIPEQTVPIKAENEKDREEEFSAAVYSNVFAPTLRKGFVNNEKESLSIANDFKGLKYYFAEETQCGENEKSNQGTIGSYRGTINLQLPSGNLGLEEKIEP